LSSWCFS